MVVGSKVVASDIVPFSTVVYVALSLFFIQNSLPATEHYTVPTLQSQDCGKWPLCLLKWRSQDSRLLSWLSDGVISGSSIGKSQLMGPEQRKLKLFSACNRLTVGESKKAEEILHCSQLIYIYIFLIEMLFI